MPLPSVLAILALIGSGLMAGVFFAFSSFVMAALARLPPAEGMAAMQRINLAVINPWFLAAFIGTPAACVVLAVMASLGWGKPGSGLLLAGSILHIAGSLLVTIACNVPLNDALAAAAPDSTAGAALWGRYLVRWTAWNHVRTVACGAAAAMLAVGLALAGAAT